MKTPFLSIAVITLSAITLFSCKKDKETTGESSGPTLKTFALKVDGTSLQTEFYSSQHTAGMLIIQTNINGNLIFGLNLADSLQVGTYPMGQGLQAKLIHSDDNYATPAYISDPGTLTITAHDTINDKITGTYNCTLTRVSPAGTKTVTGGEFNIQY
ncbi:MAG: DUF6252 family protein [Bacteroidota bacterium]